MVEEYWNGLDYVSGEVIVGFISDVSCTSYEAVKLIEQNGGRVKEVISADPIMNIVLVGVPEGYEESFIKNISKASIVKYAKLNYKNVVIQGQRYFKPPQTYAMASSSRVRYERLYIPHMWVGGGVPMGWHGDDAAWQYPLPFNFSFYGVNYSRIFVSSNGLITFTTPDTDYSNSISALVNKLAIAPAWDDWITEDPYDIFIWENSTHVGIRWYVRSYGASTIANFEAILNIKGEIQFNYEFNDGPVSATIGISDGTGNILAEDVTSLNYINSIIFRPYIPEHDLSVSLASPRIAKLDGTVTLNATVVNDGLSNETHVTLMLIVNGSTVYSIIVPELPAGESYTLHYVWSPTIEGVYNITAFAPPMVGEEFIENNFYTEFVEVTAGYLPTDPMYFLQWHLRQIGCPKAWEITTGSSNVIVAVIDTGVDYDHPDLFANAWTNSYEVPYNGVDDDGNGYVDDWIGWDFADEDNDPMDCDGHGTHCAGIIAAMMDNGVGGCGVAPNVKIMAVKIFRPAPCAVATTVRENVTDPDNTIALLRKFRDGFLKTKYVKLYYECSPYIVKILLEETDILYKAARLIEKYTPAIKYIVEGKGEDILMTTDNIDEILSFTRRLKREVDERRESIGDERSSKIIGILEEFEEQVRASEGKMFSQAFRSSVYYGRNIRAFMARVETTDAWVIKGIKYAADNGAHIISMSFGGYESETGPKPDIEDACEYAYSKGCVLVAAAGNDAMREVCYPAKYDSVIAVSAIGYNNLYSWYTNYGPEIELCAPGGSDLNGDGDTDDENEYIYSTIWDDTYGGPGWVGTSMATPHVSGVAALIKSIHPDWSNEQIRHILRSSATDLGAPGRDEVYGYGKVNAHAALTSQPPEHDLSIRMYIPRILLLNKSVLINATVINCGLNNETNVELQLLINGTVVAYALVPELSTGASYILTYNWTPTVPGKYNVTAYAPPLPEEEFTENNFKTRIVKVTEYIFFDDFNIGLIQWNNFGSPTPSTFQDPSFEDGWGYSTEGDSWYQSGSWSKQLINLSNGIVIEFRVRQEVGDVWDMFCIIGVGRLQSGYREDYWPYYFGVGVNGRNPDGSPEGTDDIYYVVYVNETFVREYREDAANDHQFHIFKIVYDGSTNMVEFYKDDNFVVALEAGPRPYDELPLLISGRDYHNTNYLDWIRVSPFKKPEHDLAVSLDAPAYMTLSSSTLLNATVRNRGLNNETNVELYLLINGTIVRSVTIPELHAGKSHAINYLWTPTVEGIYNMTVYAPPIPGEESTANNIITKMVRVMAPIRVAVLGDFNSQLTNLLWENGIIAQERDWGIITDIYNYDVVIINRPYDPGPTTFQALLEAADQHRVGLVFTSSWPSYEEPYGISLLQRYLSDPQGQEHDYGQGSVYYQVLEEHPIFEGWSVGDTIYIITRGDCDHAWFWGYTGMTIANIGADSTGIRGGGIAYKIRANGNKHLLLAGLAPQYYANTAHWTDEAKLIFIRGVLWASKPEVIPLSVSISPLSVSILVGQSITFTSTVSGGVPPYSYQWFLNGSAVSGATSATWTFTPSTAGTYIVHLRVSDSAGNVAVSETATVLVAPQLTVSISPMSASLLVGQTITFTSTVSGGFSPYCYQWYLNGAPVSGATSPTWTFTPTTSGIYYIQLKVTDAKGNIAQSDAARIAVATVPVGGYSIPIQNPTKTEPILPYIALIATLTIVLTKIRKKTKRRH